MFSNVTNQMSSWLGGLSKKTPDSAENPVAEQHSEHSDKEKETQESKTDTPTSQKSVKGSLDEQDDRSSTTEGADSNISSPAGSPSHDKDKSPMGAMPDIGGMSEKLNQGAKTFGSFISSAFNKAGKTVSEAGSKIKKSVAENSMLTEFNRENEAFVNSKKASGDAVAPWVGYADEETLKEQILALSTDNRNFVRSPPSGVQFQFDMDTFMPVATAVLKEDPELEKRRYELVPKAINEETFWRNYFYRVSLIRQSSELSSLAQEGQDSKDSSRTSSVEVADAAKDAREEEEAAERPDSPHEFVSDSIQPSSQDLEEVRAGIRQLGMNKKAPAGL
ncbi:synapse-associated protein of 47 kDa-like isoform X2 [Pollicipes pollicipes]|uniref:synapse-associated protein of 47 kDa-like isoform X2 n=1 Tax=Pollicipes pollicipes TaxID=41117 RepID=UPI001884AFC3|nr:synapse-associated protein of 47 kDa-like isoform X2 [Pollicipes pollicipes]